VDGSYRREIRLTLVFLVLFLVSGHLGIWFSLFPVDPDVRLFGFPAHYTIMLLASWPGLRVLVALYARAANRFDREAGITDDDVALGPPPGGKPSSPER